MPGSRPPREDGKARSEGGPRAPADLASGTAGEEGGVHGIGHRTPDAERRQSRHTGRVSHDRRRHCGPERSARRSRWPKHLHGTQRAVPGARDSTGFGVAATPCDLWAGAPVGGAGVLTAVGAP